MWLDQHLLTTPPRIYRPVYPWRGGEQMLIKPHKLFVDGDSWYSDMSKLGEKVGISDTLCLDSIKVVHYFYGIKTQCI